jgi:hypothetical protein
MLDLIFTYIAPILFIGFWAGFCFVDSKMAGWNSMAESYPLRTPYSGKRFTMETACLGNSNYKSGLTLGPNQVGLYIDVSFLYRWWHPPLFIPWNDITHVPVAPEDEKKEVSVPFLKLQLTRNPFIELQIAKNPGKPLKISQKLAQSLVDASGGAFQLNNSET